MLSKIVRKLRSLRALVKGSAHDPWLVKHPSGQQKSPNVGPNLGGGGT